MPSMALLLAAAMPAASVTIPDRPALTEAITARDAELFELFFTGACDETRMRSMITDDVEFYHDKAGVTARNANEFVSAYAKNCKGREDPKAWRSRRELVRSSLHVDPVPGFGAIEAGDHLFLERHGVDGTEQLAGKARFAMLWALGTDGQWRLARVLSYAHGPAK